MSFGPSRCAVAILILAVASLHTSPHPSQARVLITGSGCEGCAIEVEELVVLGDPSGEGMLESVNNWVRTDTRGRFYVYSIASPYFWVFDEQGALIHRIGREGQGPGEFRRISALLIDPWADRFFVFDPTQRRMTIYTSDYEFIRTVPLGFVVDQDAVAVRNGIVVNASMRDSARVGYPLHVIDELGNIGVSFGSENGLFRPDLREIIEGRAVGPAASSSVWAGWINQYVIERWESGKLEVVVSREVDWFEPWWRVESLRGRAPDPYLSAVRQTGDVLWVIVTVPDPEWASTIRPSGGTFIVEDRHKYVDTIIEAIDYQSGRLIASRRFDREFREFAGDGLVFSQGADLRGDEAVQVWAVHITRPGQEGEQKP